jgi:putative iron-dependent peroxidase
MKSQAAILDSVPAHARHLFLDLNPSAHPRAALRTLAAGCDGETVLLGLGIGIVEALGLPIQGLRAFPELAAANPSIPSTQHALSIWLRGNDPGPPLLHDRELQALIDSEFTLVRAIDSFLYRDSRDRDSNEELDEAPESAHVERTARRELRARGLRAQIDALGGWRRGRTGVSCLRQVLRCLRGPTAAHDRA